MQKPLKHSVWSNSYVVQLWFRHGVLTLLWYAWPALKKHIVFEKPISQEHGVQWKKFTPELIEEAKKQGKPIVIDFYADWCAACLELDELTFTEDIVIQKSKNFVMLKVDATSPTDKVQTITKKYKVYGLPTILFIDRNGQVREDLTLTGFEEAQDFIERMNQVDPHP